jgi:hypothetical protein
VLGDQVLGRLGAEFSALSMIITVWSRKVAWRREVLANWPLSWAVAEFTAI